MCRLIDTVIEQDLCIACGACVEVCPKEALVPAYNHYRGASEVALRDRALCKGCEGTCESVCPSVSVDYQDAESVEHKGGKGCRLGSVLRVDTGFAAAYQRDGVSSSGGVVKAIIQDALEHGLTVICLQSTDHGYRAAAMSSVSDMGRIPGSIYHSVSFVEAISLLRESEAPCMLVAIPCVLEGIVKFIESAEPALADKLHTRLGLICGWMYSDHAWKAVKAFKKLPGKVNSVSYRGGDRYGNLEIGTTDGKYVFSRRNFDSFSDEIQYKAAFSRVFNRRRCRVCQNHTNLHSDISVGDAWLSRFAAAQEKQSIVVTRTARGQALLSRLSANGVVQLTGASVEDIVESQSANLVYGESAQKYAGFMCKRSGFAPEFVYSDTVTLKPGGQLPFYFEEIWRMVVRRGWYRFYLAWSCARYVPSFVARWLGRLARTVRRVRS